MAVGYSFDQKDASALAQSALAGLNGGGFTFGSPRIYGGAGNTLTSTPTSTATLTPAQTTSATRGGDGMAPAVPFADGLLGFGGGAGLSVSSGSGASSLLLPAAILGGALLLAVILRR